jgi:endonuclease/exonuclease/phosphatase (EEP) superfamily protein YafD
MIGSPDSKRALRDTLLIAQTNLQHSMVAVHEIRDCIATHGVDVLCAQEVYAVDGIVTGLGVHASMATTTVTELHCISALTSIHSAKAKAITLSQFTDTHCVCVEVRHSGGSFHLVNIYCQFRDPIELYLQKLDAILAQLHGPVIITGDFNARSTVWFDRITDSRGQRLEDFISRWGLFVANEPGNAHTYSHNGESTVDVTLASASLINKIQGWQVHEDWTTSDHRAITFELCGFQTVDSIHGKNKNLRYHLRKADWKLLELNLSLNIKHVERMANKLATPENIADCVDELTKVIQFACEDAIPMKKVPKAKGVTWWSNELTEGKKLVNSLRKAFQSERDPILRQQKQVEYASWRNQYMRKVRIQKSESFRRLVTNEGNKDPWGFVYKYQTGKASQRRLLGTVSSGHSEATSWASSSNVLLNTLLPDDTNDTQEQAVLREEVRQPLNTTNDPDFTAEETREAVMSMKRGKAPGSDLIEVKVVQQNWEIIGPTCVLLFNACLKFGIFPKVWKTGKVIIIPKAGDRDLSDARSYRPIKLLPVLGKAFEKLINRRLLQTIENNGGFSGRQYGFRSGRSTEDAVCELIKQVKATPHKYALGLFLDISGAFDNLWWVSVLSNLRRLRCPQNVYMLIRDYLNERKAVIEDHLGLVEKTVTRGAPQGSVLGPTMWNIVFDTSMMAGITEVAFADDKVIIVTGNSRKEIQERGQDAIDKMIAWCDNNKLSLSSSKTVILQLKGRYDSARPPTIRANGTSIKMVSTVRYLGVDMDERLGVKTHVQRISEKAKTLFHRFTRLSAETWGLDSKTLLTIYRAVVEPIMTYCSAGWFDRANVKHVEMMESAQRNMVLRIIRGYRTVSKEAALVIAGTIPMGLLLKEKFDLFHRRTNDRTAGPLKSQLREETLQKWKERWDSTDVGRHAHMFINDATYVHDNRDLLLRGPVVQFITGHGKFREYLSRVGVIQSGGCISCGVDETPQHVLFNCPLYDDIRNEINLDEIERGLSRRVTPSDLLHDRNLKKLSLFCHKAHELLKTNNQETGLVFNTQIVEHANVRHQPPRRLGTGNESSSN